MRTHSGSSAGILVSFNILIHGTTRKKDWSSEVRKFADGTKLLNVKWVRGDCQEQQKNLKNLNDWAEIQQVKFSAFHIHELRHNSDDNSFPYKVVGSMHCYYSGKRPWNWDSCFMETTDQCLTAVNETSDILEKIRKGTNNTTVNMIYAPA